MTPGHDLRKPAPRAGFLLRKFKRKLIPRLIEHVERIDARVYARAGGAGSRRGTGGMKTKLRAAELATARGVDAFIANGKRPEALYEIIRGNGAGTMFAGKRH